MEEAATKTPVETQAKPPRCARRLSRTSIRFVARSIASSTTSVPMGWRLPFRRPSAFELTWPHPEGWQVAPAIDMVEKDDAFEITAELPGLDEKNVEIKLSNGVLTIKGEKKDEKEEREKEYYLSERRYGSFSVRSGYPRPSKSRRSTPASRKACSP